ncbi:Ankyrin repeat-containing domain protein [Beauveria brongniartii RCEF 3172]|uniref:Ankyrin repeat-containing domain protein n=1 Tax=Beauveria brongniartii RCEF 3172 TaxID=1081107 RepID=A0A162JNN6_9HYPO|nr:Ankyrin repeat-containing domain protein [Beauveria brongniartii RCEF 3172]
MADPLSVAGLAFAVVSLGLQVTAGITDYFDALTSRDQDIAFARQQNDTLRKTLRVIESSSSRLQNDHRAATAALRECLDSCKNELQALEITVAELVSCDQATTCRKDKIRNQGKRLLYPFNRPKLEQIATRLHDINSNLQLALQTLGLSVSQLGTERLATLEAASHTISTDILNVQSEVLAMTTPLQSMHSTLSRVETRFDDLENLFQQLLVRNPITNGAQSEITASTVTGRLLSKPGLLQETCDAAGAQAWQRSNGTPPVMRRRTSQFSRTVSMYTGGRFSCFCRRSQQLQRKNAVWGSFSLSLETTTEKHLPGCPATQVIPVRDQRQKISLTYVGLQSMLNLAIQLSFMVRSGAGGWSLGSNFTYYPLVDSDSAPAFRILRLLTCSQCQKNEKDGILDRFTWHEKLIPSAVSAILRLFRAKKASPREVDVYNRSLVHNVATFVSFSVDRYDLFPSQDESSSPLLDLLQYLIINKAPANDYDIYGQTPLSSMFGSTTYGSASDPLPAASAELLLQSNTEDNVACLSCPPPAAYTVIRNQSGRIVDTQSPAVQLYFLSCSANIAEAYGCGPLSLAILSNDLEKVELLVRKHPTTLAERNLFGHTPLHLAADKPSCLSIVVKAADTRLLNQADRQDRLGTSALETAVSLSGLNCSEESRMCQGCRCDECAVILLEADCALPVSGCLANVLHTASEQCKLTYVRHLKDRRDRLKQLALANLPTAEVERLGLTSERVLDSLASEVTQLLEDGGIAVPAALAVGRSESLPVYQALYSADDAEIFFDAGFRDTDAWNTADTMFAHINKGLPYLHWLTKHGGISWQLSDASARDIHTIHFTFMIIGKDLSSSWTGKGLIKLSTL